MNFKSMTSLEEMHSKQTTAQVSDDIYQFERSFTFKLYLMAGVFFFLGIFFNFPLRNFIEQKLNQALATIPNCPLIYKSLDVTYLFPGAYLQSVTIPGSCTGLPHELKFKELGVHLVGPSFIPPGLRIRLKGKSNTKEVNFYLSQSISKSVLKIPKTEITAGLLTEIIGHGPMKGTVTLEGLAEFSKKNLLKLDFIVSSENFALYPMNIQSFILPEINFATLLLKAHSDNGKLITFDALNLGGPNSIIQINAQGRLWLNPTAFTTSSLDINGNVKFKQAFLDQFSILNLLLASKQNNNGVYRFSVKGPLSSPTPSLL
ncbi:MAG: type II secretion system protein GspN [Bdellovibrio sp.]|nr:type II secretion system protein GspN [Bdellovibrio sp.]